MHQKEKDRSKNRLCKRTLTVQIINVNTIVYKHLSSTREISTRSLYLQCCHPKSCSKVIQVKDMYNNSIDLVQLGKQTLHDDKS